MIPLVDKPLIHYSLEETVACGVKQVIIVIAPGSKASKEYFIPGVELPLKQFWGLFNQFAQTSKYRIIF